MKKGQVTLFVIIAILIVAAAGLTIYIVKPFGLSAKISPVENRVTECITSVVNDGADMLGEQGGYIELPDFEPGTEYASTGSQFNYFGSTMPFWLYKSGNGIYKEQVPTTAGMARQLEKYLNSKILECDFSDLEDQNYIIQTENISTSRMTVQDNQIVVQVNWPVTATLGDTTQRIATHSVNVKNNLGTLYSTAKKIYDEEKSNLFIEVYARDVLVLYAPGTDVKLGCSPQIWNKQQVFSDIKDALQANLQTIKFSGSYYNLKQDVNKYFVYNLGQNLKSPAKIIYSASFPTNIEVDPSEGNLMRANPVGLQEGLGVLGFCYVPYHFVYSMSFPVVIQVFDENYKLFQYPVIVEIKNNLPRNSTIAEQPPEIANTFCQYKVQQAEVSVTDSFGSPVENASISFKCASSVCPIGETDEDGILSASMPQCVNGFILSQAEGYALGKLEFSTNEEGSAAVIMPKLYNLNLNVLADGSKLGVNESAIISFVSPSYSANIYYPSQKSVELIAETYNLSVFVFKDGNIELGAQSTETCINVPRNDILGFFGAEREECYTIETPTQILSQLPFGGGVSVFTAYDDEMSESSEIEVSAPSIGVPKTIDELQNAYIIIPANDLIVELT